MPANTGSPYGRPNGVPPYYLGRPASLWITILSRTADRRRARDAERAGSAVDR
jgi:hypothetical protein